MTTSKRLWKFTNTVHVSPWQVTRPQSSQTQICSPSSSDQSAQHTERAKLVLWGFKSQFPSLIGLVLLTAKKLETSHLVHKAFNLPLSRTNIQGALYTRGWRPVAIESYSLPLVENANCPTSLELEGLRDQLCMDDKPKWSPTWHAMENVSWSTGFCIKPTSNRWQNWKTMTL